MAAPPTSPTSGSTTPATRVAGVWGFVSPPRRDPVSVHTFPLDQPGPRYTGRGSVPALFGHLQRLEARGRTPFAAAVRQLLGRPGPRGLTVVISDLLTPEWEAGLRHLPARGGDLVVVHVLAPEDLVPEPAGDVELVDRETGHRVEVTLTQGAVAEYRRLAAAWADDVAARCHQAGAAYTRVMAGH